MSTNGARGSSSLSGKIVVKAQLELPRRVAQLFSGSAPWGGGGGGGMEGEVFDYDAVHCRN